jgi:AraC family transcriptional regulator
LAEIAAGLNKALAEREVTGAEGRTSARVLARGGGWTVADVMCTCGADDLSYEETHTDFAVALVVAGSFQHDGTAGHALLTPGTAMLGNPGGAFLCRHEHGRGDRCVSFWYAPGYLEEVAVDAGVRPSRVRFARPFIPAIRATATFHARASAGAVGRAIDWNELATEVAAAALSVECGTNAPVRRVTALTERRITDSVRWIEDHVETPLALDALARHAGLSPYHFLRTFEAVTGVTPHQYVQRARLRLAATRVLTSPARLIDIGLDSGFGDVSNFNRAFRAEFGVSPRRYRTASPPR